MKTGFIYPPCDPATPPNLLVNSYFTNPVNQRGATSYAVSGQPTIDRWVLVGDGALNVADGYVSLVKKSGDEVDIQQNLENYDRMKGKMYTIAVGDIDGRTYSAPFIMGKAASGIALGGCIFYSVDNRNILLRVKERDGWYWSALYEGVYTADTLPPYVPPDPDLELLACQKYFWRVKFDQYETIGYGYEGPAYAFVQLSPPVQMRTKYPTLTQSGAIQLGNRAIEQFTNANCNGSTIILGINYPRVSNNVGAVYGYSSAADGVTIALSADL